MREWFEALLDQLDEPWESVGWPAFAATACFLIFVLLARTSSGWTPFIEGINLLFHEAGHPIFSIFGWESLTILGGTLMQLLVPFAICLGFLFKRQLLGTALCGQWIGQNLLNIAPYIADARAQELPLVGGGEHDWAALLSRWGMIERDTILASRIAFLGWILMFAGIAWLGWRLYLDRSRPA